jgi:AcrR family transcriptional regulator
MPDDRADRNAAEPTRGHRKKERTRRLLIDSAVQVIAERGEAFTISDVVAHAEVSNGTFYNYFDDRDALIDQVVPEALAGFAADAALIAPDEDPAMRMATISALALERAAATPGMMKVLLRLDAVQQAIAEGEVVQHLRVDLEAGAAGGRFQFNSIDTALDVVIGTLLLAARRIVAAAESAAASGGQPGPDDDRAYNRNLIEQLLRSLGVTGDEANSIAKLAVARAGQLIDDVLAQL